MRLVGGIPVANLMRFVILNLSDLEKVGVARVEYIVRSADMRKEAQQRGSEELCGSHHQLLQGSATRGLRGAMKRYRKSSVKAPPSDPAAGQRCNTAKTSSLAIWQAFRPADLAGAPSEHPCGMIR